MKIDVERTREARKRHQEGIVRLQKLFAVTPAKIAIAMTPRPKKRKLTNGEKVRRRRFAAKRRTTLKCFGEFIKKNPGVAIITEDEISNVL